jgi:hypothetical protein
MPYPQMVEYQEAVQNPVHAFVDPELKQSNVRLNALGLPIPLSGGFALTYTLTNSRKKNAVRCFHRETPSIEQRYRAISQKLKSSGNGYFVNFDFQKNGIKVRNSNFPIVKMDWVEGDPLGVWLDKNFDNAHALQKARADFAAMAAFLERAGIAHGDIQNGNVMLSNGGVKLIDYDGMFVPGLTKGQGTETGHRHFQHPDRTLSDFGPTMDRFSFIALDLSLQAIIEDKTLYKKFRDGGETIIFKANDFADPDQSEIFRLLLAKPKLKSQAKHFAAICDANIDAVPMLADFLAGKNIPVKAASVISTPTKPSGQPASYIAAFPVVNALDYAAASKHVGDRVELIGKIVEVKSGWSRRGRRPYVFINFGPWKQKIVKISIWSDGLARLSEKPSKSWVGRWVSVTGLLDPPYTSTKHHYTHLSIPVEQNGQIQQLTEAEAQFRLQSIGKPVVPRNRAIVQTIIGSPAPPQQPSSGKTGGTAIKIAQQPSPGTTSGGTAIKLPPHTSPQVQTKSPNQAIVGQIKKLATSTSTGKQSGSPQQPVSQQSSKGVFESVPAWVWVVAVIGIGYLLIPKQPSLPANQSTNQTKQFTPPAKQASPQFKPPNVGKDTGGMGGPYVPFPTTTPSPPPPNLSIPQPAPRTDLPKPSPPATVALPDPVIQLPSKSRSNGDPTSSSNGDPTPPSSLPFTPTPEASQPLERIPVRFEHSLHGERSFCILVG